MTRFEYINKNIDRFKADCKNGIISTKIILHWQVYSKYDYYLRCGYKKYLSIFYITEDFKISQEWVYKIIKQMELNYESSFLPGCSDTEAKSYS